MVALYAQNVVVNGVLMKNKLILLLFKITARYYYIKCWLTGGHVYFKYRLENNMFFLPRFTPNDYVDVCSKCGKHRSN